MRIHSITIKNYRPFRALNDVKLGQLGTVVGKNDTGKSSILRAIQWFFEEDGIDEEDVNDEARQNEDVTVEIAFSSLPDRIRVETGIDTTLRQEMLLDKDGHLRIRKSYSPEDETIRISLITQDFQDDSFAGLARLKESDLNDLCRQKALESRRAGRGIRNKQKRKALRELAQTSRVPIIERQLELAKKDTLWKVIDNLLPSFYLFEAETRTDTQEASFQREFRPIISAAASHREVVRAKNKFAKEIRSGLQQELDQICEKMKKYTDDITSLKAKPDFSWDKAVELHIYGKDLHGVDKPLEKRGSGIRRLMMVAFFEHLAEKGEGKGTKCIFGIEEPENNLHPGLQRDLVRSFRGLVAHGYQTIITTHSPVFAGSSPVEDLVLIKRERGESRSIQSPDLDLCDIARELGIEPSDQIMGYKACVFVEGARDVTFWNTVASKLKANGFLSADFQDKEIGLIPVGGSNLKAWMDMVALQKLTRRFAIIVDSDKESANKRLDQTKLTWKCKCEQVGGIFMCTRKREVENYLHINAIRRSGRSPRPYDDFSDMKKLFGENVIGAAQFMTADEILQMDAYEQDSVTHHELKETLESLLNLVSD